MSRAAAGVRGAGMRRSPRLFYGWVLTIALGITATVSYGTLSYAFPVFIVPMGVELGWSRTAVTGAFSVATLVARLASVPVGRWVDRHGVASGCVRFRARALTVLTFVGGVLALVVALARAAVPVVAASAAAVLLAARHAPGRRPHLAPVLP